ncbi:MAG TPA: hypothetical protein PLF26_16720 [Blastocatellia bacterium]|nr:hypothetical protein [Blastocatellia bacterium]
MGSVASSRFTASQLLALAIVVTASVVALAQEPHGSRTAPFDTAFRGFERSWIDARVPQWQPSATGPQSFGVYSRVYSGQRHIELSSMQPGGRAMGPFGQQRARSSTEWQLPVRPADGFANGFDSFGNPAIGPVDIQAQARMYLKQRLVSELLSKTALGRSLGIFIDSGDRSLFDKRSRLIPFISPKVNARSGQASVGLVWKF